MIVNKQVLSQATLFQWIITNHFAYQSILPSQTINFSTFSNVLKSMRKYLNTKFQHSSNLAIGIQGLGVIYQLAVIKENKLNPNRQTIASYRKQNIQFQPSTRVLAILGIKRSQQLNLGTVIIQDMDIAAIAGQIFISQKVAYWVITSYIHASLQYCLMQPDRPIKINLGPLFLSVLHKKLQIVLKKTRPLKVEKDWTKKLAQKKCFEKSQSQSVIWRDNIMGTLQQKLNIRRVIENLNKGAALNLKQSANWAT